MKLHCNRTNCQATFEAEAERQPFGGDTATRTKTMLACPVCGAVDSHWVYADDVAPEFTGTFDQKKRQRREWINNN